MKRFENTLHQLEQQELTRTLNLLKMTQMVIVISMEKKCSIYHPTIIWD